MFRPYTEGKALGLKCPPFRMEQSVYVAGRMTCGEDYLSGDFICLIEWPEMIEELIPGDALRVRLEKDLEKGFDYRRIILDRG